MQVAAIETSQRRRNVEREGAIVKILRQAARYEKFECPCVLRIAEDSWETTSFLIEKWSRTIMVKSLGTGQS
jgi:hypothetical protein